MDTKGNLLIIDDEIEILNTLKRIFRKDYQLYITKSAKEAFDVMEKFDIQVIICDQQMPEMKGTEFFSRIKDMYPSTIRILSTGYSEISDAILSINEGNIFRYLTKPWNSFDLKNSVKEAFEKRDLIRENLFFVEALKNTNIVLEDKVRERTQQLEQQKKELEAVIENIGDGISIFNNKGKYILLNKSEKEMFSSCYKYLGEVDDVYKQSKIYDVDGEKIDLENTPASRVMRGEKFKNMEVTVKFPLETLHIDVSGTPIYDSEGNFILGVLCSRDMTDYYIHKEAIKSRYEFISKMIDTFNLSVVRLSYPDLKVVNINKKAFSIVKLLIPNVTSINQLIGNRVEDLFKPLKLFDISKYYENLNEVVIEKKTKYLNKLSYMVNGNQEYCNVIFEPILKINGEIEEVSILIIDVTAEVMATIGMEKTLKLQGEFLANISHELKTPLNVIFSAAQLFSMYCNNGSLDEKKNSIVKYIDSIKQNSYRLSKLINNIVDSSKIEAGFFKLSLSNNNIVEVVEEIVMSVTDFTDIKGLNIIFDTDIEEKIIACDPEKIERILLNLISNAIKFSEDGDEILVYIKDKGEFVEISVKDNGVGIKKKHLEMIFDRFRQVDKSLSRNAEGTGIGLSLVKSIVELHGGSITVESEFGKGSNFTVKLPSRNVPQENMLLSNKIRNRNEGILVELSDIYV